mgnify:CR=1 FL=1
MITMSTLCRSVFDQTNVEETIQNAWWVERRLQFMKINGLVKLIQSRYRGGDVSELDVFLKMYSWAVRPSELAIKDHVWFYDLIQGMDDFTWGMWEKIVDLKFESMTFLKEARDICKSRNMGSISYMMAIFRDEYTKTKNSLAQIDRYEIKQKTKSPTQKSIDKWDSLKNFI